MKLMNALSVLVVAGPLMAMAGASAVAGQSAALPANEAVLQLADNDDFAARKDAYIEKMRDEMAEWRHKLHGAGERVEAKTQEASADAKAHLDRTWSATEQGWRDLQAESAEGWDKTKNEYERLSAELRVQWHQVHPEDKD